MMHTGINKFQIYVGEIFTLKLEALVNLSEPTLLAPSLMADQFFSHGGPEFRHAVEDLHGCELGKAKITKGYNLLCNNVIHMSIPVYKGSDDDLQIIYITANHSHCHFSKFIRTNSKFSVRRLKIFNITF